MKLGFAAALALASTSMVSVAIAQTTIGDLQRQNSVTIAGEVIRVQGDDFILNDGTGQILVEAESRPIRQANLQVGDRITVAGSYGDDNEFEALSLTPSNGEVIYIFDD
jgi:uncharacterized protein YdeI (BOF family)